MATKSAKSIVGEFSDPKSLLNAAEALKNAGYKNFETYSPYPIHGMDDAMGLKHSVLGWIVLCGGATGLIFALTLQWWTSAVDYKLTISGKPFFSYQAFVPVSFECMVLFSAFCAVFGMLALNKLPQLYHSVFKHSRFHNVTSHSFFVSVDDTDPKFNLVETQAFLSQLGGTHVEVIKD
jgi:hypothetical protein